MHRAIAAWLIAKPLRAVLVTAIASVVVPGPLFAGAIPVLLTLAHGLKWGLQATIAAVIAFGAVTIAADLPIAMTIVMTTVMFVAPFVLARIFERSGSLRLCFQLAVLAAGLMVATIHATLDDAEGAWHAYATRYFAALANQSGNSGGFASENWTNMVAATNWGSVALNCMLASLGLLFLGAWWLSLVRSPGAFGKEFQGIQLGKALGYGAVLLLVAASALYLLKISVPLIDALAVIAVGSLVLQGMSVMHRAKAQGRLGRGWLVIVYVSLFAPYLAAVAVPLLSVLGMVDNWRRIA